MRPIQTSERYEILDVLRGFALFGVLAANLSVNVLLGALASGDSTAPDSGLDTLATVLLQVFVRGKFISIFAFLFGFGFAIQVARARARDVSAVPIYRRRLFWLLILGLAHLLFLWWGDILSGYALGGLLLIACHRLPDRKLLTLGLAITVTSLCLDAGRIFLQSHVFELIEPGSAPQQLAAERERLSEQIQSFASGNYIEVVLANVLVYGLLFLSGTFPLNYGHAYGLFLLGFLAGRRRLLIESSPDDDERLSIWRRRSLAVGLVSSVVWIVLLASGVADPSSGWSLLVSPLSAISVLGLATYYVTALTLRHRSPRWRPALAWLAPVGRMALTNYLAQSLAFVGILYGIGLGLLQQIGPALSIPLSVAIFLAQILLSRWWLQRFSQGPVEWLWRRLTYGRLT